MSLILAVVISAPNIHNTTGHRLVTSAVSSPVAGIHHNVTLAVTCSPAPAAAGGGSAIIEEAGGKRGGETVPLGRAAHPKRRPFCDGTPRGAAFQADTRAEPPAAS